MDVGFTKIEYDKPHQKSHFIQFSIENEGNTINM